MVLHDVQIPEAAVAAFCKRHHIRRLALFGSILRPEFGPESDVDVLVEFEPGQVPGWDFFAMQDELSEILGRHVDLNTRGFLSHFFRDQVEAQARVIYGPR